MRLLLLGHGRMGRLVEALAPEYGCEVAGVLDETSNDRGEGLLPGRWPDVDVAIDFSVAAAVEDNVRGLAAAGINVVIGTTGWQDASVRVRQVVERSGIGAVAAPNFSTGCDSLRRDRESGSAPAGASRGIRRVRARDASRCQARCAFGHGALAAESNGISRLRACNRRGRHPRRLDTWHPHHRLRRSFGDDHTDAHGARPWYVRARSAASRPAG